MRTMSFVCMRVSACVDNPYGLRVKYDESNNELKECVVMHSMWLNLTVKDIQKSKDFYEQLGFEIMNNAQFEETMFAIKIAESMTIIFIEQNDFEQTTKQYVTYQDNEMVVSIGVESREALETYLEKVQQAGGHVTCQVSEQRGVDVAYFKDVDGHQLNVVVC